ncbi:hypothetical protein Cgig2_002938 [Carnegiea gigantea]|uniref:Uncharacterized protein n=1 Tax=Carnegiea gigantea TaxID=171969 RepID=A0A9Q1JLQ2_9CARY|nr:hypothetical protein Cgig2_002938 [Carnegiea gigantea]
MDVLKNFMTIMTNTILQQVTEQVKKTMEAVSSMRPLPTFDYPVTTVPKPHNAQKYCEFHEQNDRDSVREEPREKECSTEIVATITGGYTGGITSAVWKAQIRVSQQVLMTEQRNRITVPTMAFNVHGGSYFSSLHNDPLVVELKMANEVSPTKVIHLPLQFGNKSRARNLEVNFLVVDVPMAYNVILGRPTLHKVKAIIASYLLQLQYKADNGNVGKLLGDQQTA